MGPAATSAALRSTQLRTRGPSPSPGTCRPHSVGWGLRLQGWRLSSRRAPRLTRSPRLGSVARRWTRSRLRHQVRHGQGKPEGSTETPGPAALPPSARGALPRARPPCVARGPVLGARPSCASPALLRLLQVPTQTQGRHRGATRLSSRLGSWLSTGWTASSKAAQCGPSAQCPRGQQQSHSKAREPRSHCPRLRGALARGLATPAWLQERPPGAWRVGVARAALAEGSRRGPARQSRSLQPPGGEL